MLEHSLWENSKTTEETLPEKGLEIFGGIMNICLDCFLELHMKHKVSPQSPWKMTQSSFQVIQNLRRLFDFWEFSAVWKYGL